MKKLREFGLDILYARAKTKLWEKIERLRGVPGLAVADFGTRRRHSFLWQEYVVNAMKSNLGEASPERSNAFLAHKHDLEAIGTNAHEIPMAMAALAPDDDRPSKLRSTGCLRCGSPPTTARFASCCPTLSEQLSFSRMLPTGPPTGPASASTAKILTSVAMNTSNG